MTRMLALAAAVCLFPACGIENFESLDDPHPPLGLVATSSNSQIQLTFEAYNNEEFFGGYDVYVGASESVVIDQKFAFRNELTGTYPFLSMQPFDSPRSIQLTLTLWTNQSTPLTPGISMYLGVAAFDARHNRHSKTGNVVLVTVQ